MRPIRHTLIAIACAMSASAGALGGSPAMRGDSVDEVIVWNDVLLDLFRQDFGTGCPCPLARAGAMVQAAVYEAVNSIDREYEPYIAYVDADPTASKEAAVMAAAYRTMMGLFPNSADDLTETYQARKALLPAGRARNKGIIAGNAAAMQILDERRNDGSEQTEAYSFGTHAGDYVPVPPFYSTECNPQWASRVRPFCMTRNDQFRSQGPLGCKNMDELMHSPAYAAQVNEVKTLGRRFGSTRTEEQTQIAFFWANDRNGTYKPPGHLFAITQTVSADQHLTLEENARLFALVGLAMGDAGITAWDMKYSTAIDLWRPVTAIRRASMDGNPLTTQEKSWLPLNPFSPPFPAYASGHATFGAAHAAVMAEFFGTDNITFTIDSEDPYYNALPSHPERTFTSFSQAAVENGLSRVYLGVHFRMDATDGNAAGFALGHYVGRNFLNRRCIADFNADGLRSPEDFNDFYAAYSTGNMSADVNHDSTVDSDDMADFMNAYLGGC